MKVNDIRGLYRKYTGDYYYLDHVATDLMDEKSQKIAVFYLVCRPELGIFSMKLDDFFSRVLEDGTQIRYAKYNITGQTYRFEKVTNLNFNIKDISTEDLVAELKGRDSFLNDIDIDGLEHNVYIRDYVVGKKMDVKGYDKGVDVIRTFDNEEQAKRYSERFPKDLTGVFRRTYLELV